MSGGDDTGNDEAMRTNADLVTDEAQASEARVILVVDELFGPLDLTQIAIIATDIQHLWLVAALVAGRAGSEEVEDGLSRARNRVNREVRLVSLRCERGARLAFETVRLEDGSGLDDALIDLVSASAGSAEKRPDVVTPTTPRGARTEAAYSAVLARLSLPTSPDDTVADGGHRFNSADIPVALRLVLNNAVEALSCISVAERDPVAPA